MVVFSLIQHAQCEKHESCKMCWKLVPKLPNRSLFSTFLDGPYRQGHLSTPHPCVFNGIYNDLHHVAKETRTHKFHKCIQKLSNLCVVPVLPGWAALWSFDCEQRQHFISAWLGRIDPHQIALFKTMCTWAYGFGLIWQHQMDFRRKEISSFMK